MKGIFTDLVGTLVKGKTMEPFEDVVEKFNQLKNKFKIVIITNNTTETPDSIKRKLSEIGFNMDGVYLLTPLVVLQDVLNDSEGDVFYIGSDAVKEIIINSGKTIKENGSIVVVGLDLKLTYEKLYNATNLILNGAKFIGLHRNRLFLKQPGKVAPSVGSTIAFLEYASGRKAKIIGKPEKEFFKKGCNIVGLSVEDVWVIGDDPYSEVSAPQSIGFKAIFVKSGKYKYTPPDIIPDRVYNNFVEVDWENL